jgi:hypothetical protein
MVRKTKNRRNVSEKKKNKKRITRKRRGGKKKIDWENGEWSKEPTIHATFKTQGKTGNTECEYSLNWNYHYLDEDDNIPLENPKNGEKKLIQKRELLQLFTRSEVLDKDRVRPENLRYSYCKLTKEKVLELLEKNEDFQKKIDDEKKKIEEMVKVNRNQKELIKKIMENKKGEADKK